MASRVGCRAGALAWTLALAGGVALAQPPPSRADAGPTIIDVPLDAEAPSVSAAAERGEALLGAPFTVFVTARARAGVTVRLREPVELGPAFEVRRKLAAARARSDGGHDYEWQLEVVAWEVGELTLPAIALVFEVRGQAGGISTARTPVRIVGTLAEDSTTARDLAPPRALVRHRPAWPWLAAAALLAVLGGVLWRRRRAAALPAALGGTPRQRRAHVDVFEQARRRLDELEASGALAARQKEGYVELAAVLYDLLGALGAFGVTDLTSGELVRVVERHPRMVGAAAALTRWLAAIDRVRYDAYVADEPQRRAALEQARALVGLLETGPADAAAPPAAQASLVSGQDER